jgi:2-C-methyl-D-erythritol 4-phosphate cytidylyltransferase
MAASYPGGQLSNQAASKAVHAGPHAMSNGASSNGVSSNGPTVAPPKQFLTIGGEPILIHSLRAFLAVDRVDQIYVAVRAQEIARVRQQIEDAGMGLCARIFLVEGGANRQDSVSKALKALPAEADDVVLVHDAVRPLIDEATIDRTIDAVLKHGAAIVGLPAVDTIKQVERTADGALVSSTIPRERVVYAQTPQGACYASLKRAFDEADTDEFLGTDEASLLERAGVPVMVVAGSARNFKITQPGDLELAEFYLASAAEKA